MRHEPERTKPTPVEGLLVRYSAEEMPVAALGQLQRQTLDQLADDDIDLRTTFRIINLLLTISIQKLTALAEAEVAA
jgi:hypothetical protein